VEILSIVDSFFVPNISAIFAITCMIDKINRLSTTLFEVAPLSAFNNPVKALSVEP